MKIERPLLKNQPYTAFYFMQALQNSTRQLFAFLLAAMVMFFASTSGVLAQNNSEYSAEKQENQRELEQIGAQLEASRTRQENLKEEIAALNSDIGAINRALITATNRSQLLETEISKTENELEISIQNQSGLRKSIRSKRALLGEVIAALQRMGRNPPPAILIRPEDALSSVRSAILLGAVVPNIRGETKLLLAELRTLQEITARVEQKKKTLTDNLNALSEDETRLTLLIEEKNALTIRSKEEFYAQQERAAELANKARSLEDLIDILESEIASAAKAAELAKLADARRIAEESKRLQNAQKRLSSSSKTYGDTSRIEPAIAFSTAQGSLFLPASGVKLYDFGTKLSDKAGGPVILGSTTKNIAIQTRPNARIRTPADGWIVYAGPFRSFGNLLILNAGDGYHIILSGLDQVNVGVGRFVLAGEPVGRMGLTNGGSALSTDFGSKSPVLYVEFRKDGKSIDSGPWWAPQTTTLLQSGNG